MNTHHFSKIVEKDGSVHLTGLPPHKQVEVVILERTELSEEMKEWLSDVRVRHPFAKMSKDEILNLLRQTRETVWADRHES